MRFWIGLIISLLGGLIGIGLFREWIRLLIPTLNDSFLDVSSLIIILIGLILTAVDHIKQSKYLKKIENEQKGRIIESTQKQYLLQALNQLEKTEINLIAIQGDRESIKFANKLKSVFIEGNWEVDGVWEDIILGGIGFGVTIREKSNKPDSTGKKINNIFNENRIKSKVVVMANLKGDQIQIIVGSRP